MVLSGAVESTGLGYVGPVALEQAFATVSEATSSTPATIAPSRNHVRVRGVMRLAFPDTNESNRPAGGRESLPAPGGVVSTDGTAVV